MEQIAKNGDLKVDLIVRQYKLDKMANFMEIKSDNPKLKQSELAKELAVSTSTLQRYRRETNVHLHYRKVQSSNTNTKKTKDFEPYWARPQDDLKWPQNDLKWLQRDLKRIR